MLSAEGGGEAVKYLWGTLLVFALIFLACGIYYFSNL